MKFHVVYKTTNRINGKIYIGVHTTDKINDSYKGSGRLLIKAFKKHGVKNFEKSILFVFNTREEAYLKEKELVTEELILGGTSYNLAVGGRGPLAGSLRKPFKYSKETIQKLRNAKLGSRNPMHGGLTQRHKETLKTVMKEKAVRGKLHCRYGIPVSDAVKQNLRITSKISYDNLPILKCEHCGIEMKKNLYARYHGDKCKNKNVS